MLDVKQLTVALLQSAQEPHLKQVPIIMITSRTGEKHRQRAFEIGVERYLGKPYQEADLLRNVQETLSAKNPGLHRA